MEEDFLCLLLTGDKVDVIYQQHINTSVSVVEFLRFPLLESSYKLVSKLLSTDIKHLKTTG